MKVLFTKLAAHIVHHKPTVGTDVTNYTSFMFTNELRYNIVTIYYYGVKVSNLPEISMHIQLVIC